MAKKKRTRKNNSGNPKPRIKPVCKFYLEGRCNKGDQCSFLHSGEAKESNSEPVPAPALPPGLSSCLHLLTPEQRALATALCHAGQCHLFASWHVDSNDDIAIAKKKAMLSKLLSVDASYPTGLTGYIANARRLLQKSRAGVNPLEGWKPNIPVGRSFVVGSAQYLSAESAGLNHMGKVGFVLVAGGLGERLGYSDIKIQLPVETCTDTCYIQYYVSVILAYQSRYAEPGKRLPLCIMTSEDTHDRTCQVLKSNNYFGMEEQQVTIVKQGMGVPALMDNEAKIALDEVDGYDVLLKPHGHGDIHALLHTHGVAKAWLSSGIEWMTFFQDTNGLAFHTLALSLGVSAELGLIMNSIACPRKAGQAIGAITKLTKGDEIRTINVEYNQLDPLFKASGSQQGDINDPNTGYSPYPGNINQLLFRLKDYAQYLEKTQGIMPEFVNPKYADEDKTVFKKPTRLECMMQDFPTVLTGKDAEKVGFTSLASELCFSPVKNATSDGIVLQAKGTHPGVAATGEADQSGSYRKLLQSIGCNIQQGPKVKYSGIEVISGPDLVLKPSFAVCLVEFKAKFTNPSEVKISGRSSLVVAGEGLTIESLDLDGALIIECEAGATGVIRNLAVRNKGWVKVPVNGGESCSEVVKMRGYRMDKIETRRIVFKADGSIEGDYCDNAVAETTSLVCSESTPKDETIVQAPKLTPTNGQKEKPVPSAARTNNPPVSEDLPANAKSGNTATNTELAPAPAAAKIEMKEVVDLNRPSSREQKEKDTLCGGACVIL